MFEEFKSGMTKKMKAKVEGKIVLQDSFVAFVCKLAPYVPKDPPRPHHLQPFKDLWVDHFRHIDEDVMIIACISLASHICMAIENNTIYINDMIEKNEEELQGALQRADITSHRCNNVQLAKEMCKLMNHDFISVRKWLDFKLAVACEKHLSVFCEKCRRCKLE